MADVYHLFRADGTYDGWSPDPNVPTPAGGVKIQAPQLPAGVKYTEVTNPSGGTIRYTTNQDDIDREVLASLAWMAWQQLASLQVLGAMARVLVKLGDGNVGVGTPEQGIIDELKGAYLTAGFGDETATSIQDPTMSLFLNIETVLANLPAAPITADIIGTVV